MKVGLRIKALAEDTDLEVISVQPVVETMGVGEIILGECKKTAILNLFFFFLKALLLLLFSFHSVHNTQNFA